jgi:hypothetical protein
MAKTLTSTTRLKNLKFGQDLNLNPKILDPKFGWDLHLNPKMKKCQNLAKTLTLTKRVKSAEIWPRDTAEFKNATFFKCGREMPN